MHDNINHSTGEDSLHILVNLIYVIIAGLSPSVAECLKSLHFCDFLCLEDLHSAYKSFLATGPTPEHCLPHVNRFMDMESRIEDIPSSFTIGPLRLSTKPAKSSLMALAVSWKMLFSATIYTDAKVNANMETTLAILFC